MNAIGSMQSAGQVRQSLAIALWRRAAGEIAARASCAVEVQNRVLIVKTKSSSWSHELSMQKSELIKKLNRMLDGGVIEDIKFRTDGTTWVNPEPEQEAPTGAALDSILLTVEEQADLAAALQDTQSITDERIRRSINVRIGREARLRHWRLEHGWRECAGCGAAHTTGEGLCPICMKGAGY